MRKRLLWRCRATTPAGGHRSGRVWQRRSVISTIFVLSVVRQLENKKKRLIQEQKEQERKDRTNRLCKRMGFVEKLLPGTIPLTEEQFKTFVEQTIATEHSRRVLDGLTAQNAATAPAQGEETAARGKGLVARPGTILPRPCWALLCRCSVGGWGITVGVNERIA